MQNIDLLASLFNSYRWSEFLASTATGLYLNLIIIQNRKGVVLQAPESCPCCGKSFGKIDPPEINANAVQQNIGLEMYLPGHIGSVTVMPLQDNFSLVARECSSCGNTTTMPLKERAAIAQKMLSSFLTVLSDSLLGGRKSVELSTLRQLNNIVTSLFQGQNNAVEYSFNLILSALVILTDAQGSWISYCKEGTEISLIRGDEAAVRAYQKSDDGTALTEDISNSRVTFKIGILAPPDRVQAKSILSLLAQECLIVIEIDRLFQLVKTQLSMVLGSVGSAVMLINQHGSFTYANKAAEKLLNIPVSKIIGSPVEAVRGPWTQPVTAKTEETLSGRLDILGQEHFRRRIDWQVCPVRDTDSLVGWLVLADDRSDYYRWQESGRRAERLAVTATMVGALAHELRNPLSAAKGLLQLMGRKRDPERVASYSDLVIRELDRVTRLLNEFLLMGKPAEAGGEPTDPASFLQELMPLLEGEALVAGAEISFELQPVPPVIIDLGQMTQVILNLVRNAVEEVGDQGKVILRLRCEADWVLFEVRDNGAGLSEEAKAKLFQPFFTTKERGTGLGLPVSHAIVHNHGGQLTATNPEDGGALFTVLLPAYRADSDHTTCLDVLVAIEDEVVRLPCEHTLRAAGLKTAGCSGLCTGILELQNTKTNLLLTDAASLNGDMLGVVRYTWPDAPVLAVGDPPADRDEQVRYISPQLDYSNLVSLVRSMIKRG